MDLEFLDSLISDTTEKIDDEWLLCRFCIDAWQPKSKEGNFKFNRLYLP